MKRKVEEWTIEKIFEKRDQILTADFQREPKLWSQKDMELLIDSILMDIDIPKLYFAYEKPDEYEIIDGQQRLIAIWGFVGNRYTLRDRGNKRFDELDPKLQKKILEYELQIAIITGADEDYLRELFLRLQLGLLLVTGEKLHAKTGVMKDFVFRKMKGHPFFKLVNIPDRRYAKETLCAQICINSFSRQKDEEFSRTRYEDLSKFFEEYTNPKGPDLSFFEDKCKSIMDVLATLNDYFKGRDSGLRNRSFILSVYLFVEELVKGQQKAKVKEIMPIFVAFVSKLLERLKEEAKLGIKRKNEELYKFESYLSNAPGEKYQIERRHNELKEFFEYYQKTGKIKGDK